jgi:hypothetical protein
MNRIILLLLALLLTSSTVLAAETKGNNSGVKLRKVKSAKVGEVVVKLGDESDIMQEKLSPYFIKMIGYSNDKPCHDSLYIAGTKKTFLTWCSDGGVSQVKSIKTE